MTSANLPIQKTSSSHLSLNPRTPRTADSDVTILPLLVYATAARAVLTLAARSENEVPLENTNSFRKMFAAVALCRGVFLDVPLLVLVYTALDALAWARYGDEVPDVKERFVRFCDEYILSEGQFRCAALDLYSARCAMLHCLGWESRLSMKGHAKAVVYAFGPGQSRAIKMLERKAPGRFVDVNADDLASALEAAYERVRSQAHADPRLFARLQQAEGEQLASISPNLAALMADHPTGFPAELLADPSEATSLYRASISFSM